MLRSYPLTVKNDIIELVKKQEEFSLYVIPEQITACIGLDGYNKKYCEDNNILILDFGYSGGTVITTPEDLNVVIALKDDMKHQEILAKISEIMNKLGVKTEIRDNDIFLNNNKFCGIGSKRFGDITVYFLQISFSVNLPLIQAVCTKEMIKIPKGIKDFYPNASRDGLIKELQLWKQ